MMYFFRAKTFNFRYNNVIPTNRTSHRASYDEDGNIVLPTSSEKAIEASIETRIETETFLEEEEILAGHMEELPWEMTEVEEESEAQEQETHVSVREKMHKATEVWHTVRSDVYELTSDALQESARQYKATLEDSAQIGSGTLHVLRKGSNKTWRFLTQPVWVPGRNNKPKQYGRGTLFLLDTIRFGGTFAALFTGLFVTLNYQSFWSIAESHIEPLAELTGMKEVSADKQLAEKLKNVPSLAVAGTNDGIMEFLPLVGPPDNRLIIPSLDLNVPIQIPSNAALMQENWGKLEEDIQFALQDGVVHYPGTAQPGKPGNFFVTGHSSYFPWAPGDFKSVFARLHELHVGDEYWVFYGGDRHRYLVTEKKEIKPSDVTVLDQPVSKRVSTLMTCTPVGTTLRRLILVAQEIDPITAEPLEVGEKAQAETMPKLRMQALPI